MIGAYYHLRSATDHGDGLGAEWQIYVTKRTFPADSRLKAEHAIFPAPSDRMAFAMSWRITNFLLLFLVLAAALLQAQAPAAAEQNPTFKANTRLVLLDVVVTDSNGQPVHDLKSEDFTVMEDGKPQRVVTFEEQRPDATLKATKALNLPKNIYTNFVTRADSGGPYHSAL